MLPITDCANCGACCFEQGSPPGYLAILSGTPWPDGDDHARFAALPYHVRETLLIYRAQLMSGEVGGDWACCWIDQETKRCRFYDHRPDICREFEVGSEGCRCWRDEYNIDIEALR